MLWVSRRNGRVFGLIDFGQELATLRFKEGKWYGVVKLSGKKVYGPFIHPAGGKCVLETHYHRLRDWEPNPGRLRRLDLRDVVYDLYLGSQTKKVIRLQAGMRQDFGSRGTIHGLAITTLRRQGKSHTVSLFNKGEFVKEVPKKSWQMWVEESSNWPAPLPSAHRIFVELNRERAKEGKKPLQTISDFIEDVGGAITNTVNDPKA